MINNAKQSEQKELYKKSVKRDLNEIKFLPKT